MRRIESFGLRILIELPFLPFQRAAADLILFRMMHSWTNVGHFDLNRFLVGKVVGSERIGLLVFEPFLMLFEGE